MNTITADMSDVSRDTEIRKHIHQLECTFSALSEEVVGSIMCRATCCKCKSPSSGNIRGISTGREAFVGLKFHGMNEIWEQSAIVDEERR